MMNRRSFIQKTALLPLAAWVVSCSKKEETKNNSDMSQADIDKLRQQDQVEYVKEGEAIAAALKYKHDASQVPADLRKERAGTPGSEQFCSNCQFYEAVEGKPYGACSLLKNKGMVKEGGWCFSWAIKRPTGPS